MPPPPLKPGEKTNYAIRNLKSHQKRKFLTSAVQFGTQHGEAGKGMAGRQTAVSYFDCSLQEKCVTKCCARVLCSITDYLHPTNFGRHF